MPEKQYRVQQVTLQTQPETLLDQLADRLADLSAVQQATLQTQLVVRQALRAERWTEALMPQVTKLAVQ